MSAINRVDVHGYINSIHVCVYHLLMLEMESLPLMEEARSMENSKRCAHCPHAYGYDICNLEQRRSK